MKNTWMFPAILLSASAFATPIPSTLPDGKYTMECQTMVVQKFDSDPSGMKPSDQTSPDGISRSLQYQAGTSLFVTSGDTTTVKETFTMKAPHFSGSGEDYTQKTVKKVDDAKYEESATNVCGSG